MRKSVFYVLVALLGFSACSKDDDNTEIPFDQLSIDEQIAKIKEMPYASLTPDQQKVKLEQDGMDFMKEMDKTKTSVDIKTLQNFQDLLNKSSVDVSKTKGNSNLAILKTKANSNITEILNITDIFGVFTWNATTQSWDETKSTKELKFIFPSTEKGTKNNAELLVTGKSSTVSFTETDDYWDWECNDSTCYYIAKDFTYFIPETAAATLKIDGVEVATSSLKNTFTAGKKAPSETVATLVSVDGYKLNVKGVKGTTTTVTSDFTFGETVLYSAIANTSTNVDALIEKDNILYYGSANAYVKIMGNLAIISEVNFSAIATENNRIKKELPKMRTWGLTDSEKKNKDHFTQANQRNKDIAEAQAKAINDYNKSFLVSRTDGTKIATVIAKAYISDSYSCSHLWNEKTASWVLSYNETPQKVEYYDVEYYFKFNDETLVASDGYFGSGFTTLENKFREFTNEFNVDLD